MSWPVALISPVMRTRRIVLLATGQHDAAGGDLAFSHSRWAGGSDDIQRLQIGQREDVEHLCDIS